MIKLNDLLHLTDKQLSNTKIRLNKSNKSEERKFNPMELFVKDKDRLMEGQFWNYSKNKSFKEGQIAIGLFKVDNDKWLLFDISKIDKDLELHNAKGYEHTTLEEFSKYFGRVVVRYKNKSQNMIRNAKSIIDDLEVCQLLEEVYEDNEFPGYDYIDLSWERLSHVLKLKSWKTALENQKGIYLITDLSNGKRYVGSAYGSNMIFGRWSDYVKTGHGGNKDLKELGFDYIKKNFKYTLLETYRANTEDDLIIRREHYWMSILMTKNKEYGYNN